MFTAASHVARRIQQSPPRSLPLCSSNRIEIHGNTSNTNENLTLCFKAVARGDYLLPMAPRISLRAPTTASVPDTLRVPSTAKSLVKSLIRLSKSSLIDLALQWLGDDNQETCAPYLAGNRNLEEEVDEDYLWSPADTIEELRLIYNRMRFESNANKRYIIDRILDGDWRRGLSLYQVATIDFQCLSENDKTLRWTALKLVPQIDDEEGEREPAKKKRKTYPAPYPSISPETFLRNLQHQISPLVKGHYYLQRLKPPHELAIIRVCVAESPYANPQSPVQSPLLLTDPGRLIFIALPDSCPYLYVSVSGTAKDSSSTGKKPTSTRMDITTLKRNVLEEIPKALSKSQNRYSLESTFLTARSLAAMMALRGNSGTNAANGLYTIFSKGFADSSPIDADNSSFAQKILTACEGKYDQESDLSLSELSLKPQHPAEKRTALAEKTTNTFPTTHPNSDETKLELKVAAAARFGLAGLPEIKPDSSEEVPTAPTGGLDRFQIRLDEDLVSRKEGSFSVRTNNHGHSDTDPFNQTEPLDSTSREVTRPGSARMTLTFQGSNIFLGIRKLVECGVVKAEKMPAWMTGEEAVSGGTVREGILVRGKGNGA
jgi:central kinetochore subunit Mis15/CHL4